MTEDEMVGWHHQLNGHEYEPWFIQCSHAPALSASSVFLPDGMVTRGRVEAKECWAVLSCSSRV